MGEVSTASLPQINALMQQRRAMELDLRKAFVGNEFELYCQLSLIWKRTISAVRGSVAVESSRTRTRSAA
jgi:hypothetical protein